MNYGSYGRPAKAKAASPSSGKVAKLEGEVKSLTKFVQELLDQVAHNRKRAETHRVDWQAEYEAKQEAKAALHSYRRAARMAHWYYAACGLAVGAVLAQAFG